MSSYLSSAIFTSFLTISIPKKAVVHQHSKIKDYGRRRSVRKPAHSMQRVILQPSATMVDGIPKDVRPVIDNYAPSIWGDTFATSSFDDQVQQKYYEEMEELKKEVRTILMASTSTKLMTFIDKLERLGLAYHFETEIEEKLNQVYDFREDYDDLFTTALRFRLLRQHQHHVSCNAFVKFVDIDNKLKETLSSDIEGVLSLYEAAHARIHNEDILEEALAFTTNHLRHVLPQLESPLKEEVQQALDYPLHRTPTIVSLRSYIDIYENGNSRDEHVLRLAKLNFNFMQNIFRNELFELTTWWNKLDITSKIPYFRDRLVENYMWSLSYHFEPQQFLVRTVMTKYYLLAAIMDDTYDNYATFEEIELFTGAIERWNRDEIDILPEYLNSVYEFIMSFSEEFEREAENQGKSFVIPYYIESIKQVARSYAQEEKWIREKKMPSIEEYLVNSRSTVLMYVTFVALVALLKSCTKETLDWVLSESEIFVAMCDLVRLIDDVGSRKRESRDGRNPTPMDLYMKDKGVSLQEIESEFKELIEDRWKHLTAGWVNSSMIPKEMVVQFINLIRMCGTFYRNDEDGYTNPEKSIAPIASTLFIDPILV